MPMEKGPSDAASLVHSDDRSQSQRSVVHPQFLEKSCDPRPGISDNEPFEEVLG